MLQGWHNRSSFLDAPILQIDVDISYTNKFLFLSMIDWNIDLFNKNINYFFKNMLLKIQ